MSESRPTSANRILETALELFVTRGYEGTSVREICEAACITKPTLYYFYGSKEGVFRALVHGALEELRQDAEAALAQPVPFIEQLKIITRNFFAEASRRRKLWRFIASSRSLVDPSACADLMTPYAGYLKLLGDAIDAAVARAELVPGPTHIRLMVLFGAIGKAVDHFLFFEQSPLISNLTNEFADQLIDVIVTGWLAPSSSSHKHP
jgi:AcrR family transcriptional regulator